MSVKARRAAVADVPLPFRLFHLVALVGFSASAVAAAWAELSTASSSLRFDYDCGTPPGWVAIAGAGLAVLTLAVVLGGRALGHPPPLAVSALVLVGFGMAVSGLYREYGRRTPSGANRVLIDLANNEVDFFRTLAKTGQLDPKNLPLWNEAMLRAAAAAKVESPYRKGLAHPVPFSLRLLHREDEFPLDAPPGTLLVFLDPDGKRFALKMIGLDDYHHPALLKDEGGSPITLRGGAKDDIF